MSVIRKFLTILTSAIVLGLAETQGGARPTVNSPGGQSIPTTGNNPGNPVTPSGGQTSQLPQNQNPLNTPGNNKNPPGGQSTTNPQIQNALNTPGNTVNPTIGQSTTNPQTQNSVNAPGAKQNPTGGQPTVPLQNQKTGPAPGSTVNPIGGQTTSSPSQIPKTSQKKVKTTGARTVPRAPKTLPGCNQRLLATFRLTGLKAGEAPTSFQVCPIKADDNCCSANDEITILNSWNYYTQPKLHKFAEDAMNSYTKILELDPYIRNLNSTYIKYHYNRLRWRKTNETQCFNGKFFLEQVNYDLLDEKNSLREAFNKDFIEESMKLISRNNENRIVNEKMIKGLIETSILKNENWVQYIIKSMGTFAEKWAAETIGTAIADEVSKLPPDQLNLQRMKAGTNITDYINTELRLNQTLTDVVSRLTSRYRTLFLQETTILFHLQEIVDFFRETLMAKLKISPEMKGYSVDLNSIGRTIAREMRRDQTLRKYLSWFLVPDDVKKFQKVYNYLENRIYKIVSEVVVKSKTLKDISPVVFMSDFLQVLRKTNLGTLLEKNYNKIAGNIITMYVLEDFFKSGFKVQPNQAPAEKAFLECSKFLFNEKHFSKIKAIGAVPDLAILAPEVKNVIAQVAKEGSAGYGSPIEIPKTYIYPTDKAYAMFLNINRELTDYAEFIGDGKQVCAVVYKHNMVREAIFNKQKFEYCSGVLASFNQTNVTSLLTSMKEVKNELKSLLNVKQSFLCSVCSKSNSQFIDVDNNKIYMSLQGCADIMSRFKNYFMWKNLQLNNYLNLLYQYMSCFSYDGNVDIPIPYEMPGDDTLRLADEMNKCVNITSSSQAQECTNVCSKFNPATYSLYFEGNRKYISKIYNFIVNTIRQFGMRYATSVSNPSLTGTDSSAQKINEGRKLASWGRYSRRHSRRLNSNNPNQNNNFGQLQSTQSPQQQGGQVYQQSGYQNTQQSGSQVTRQQGVQNTQQGGIQNNQQFNTQTNQQLGVQTNQQFGVQANQQSGVQSNQQQGVQTNQQRGAQTNQQRNVQANQQSGAQTNQQLGVQTNQQLGVQSNQQRSVQANQQPGAQTNQQLGVQTNQQKSIQTNQQSGAQTNQQRGVQANQQSGAQTNQQLGTQSNQLQQNISTQQPGSPVNKPGPSSAPGNTQANLNSPNSQIQPTPAPAPPKLPMKPKEKPNSEIYKDLLSKIATTTEYTRTTHYNHDEIRSGQPSFTLAQENINITIFSVVVTDTGLNPISIYNGCNFNPSIGTSLWQGSVPAADTANKKKESFHKAAIKACLSVTKEEITSFNADYGVTYGEARPKVTKKTRTIPSIDYNMFKVSNIIKSDKAATNTTSTGSTPNAAPASTSNSQPSPSTSRKLKRDNLNNKRHKVEQPKKKAESKGGILNFLFKLLF